MFPSAGVLPGAKLVSPESTSLLGSPIGGVGSILIHLCRIRVVSLKRMGSQLSLYCLHMTLACSFTILQSLISFGQLPLTDMFER